jgi:hypothetical protein
MIHIPALRLKRCTIELAELTIGDAISLASMPVQQEQALITQMLKFSATSISNDLTPETLTVQERAAFVAHYLSATSGTPDFPIGSSDGKSGRLTDYVDYSNEYPVDTIGLGELHGDRWSIRQLTGAMAGAIERTDGEILSGYAHWLVGCMAAQMFRNDDQFIPPSNAIDAWIVERMRILLAINSSGFTSLVSMFLVGRPRLDHLFLIDLHSSGGIVFKSRGADLPAARFLPDATLSGAAKALGRSGAKHG